MSQERTAQENLKLEPRPVRESQSEMTEIVLPNDANPLGSLLGGRLMHWIDLAGAMAAVVSELADPVRTAQGTDSDRVRCALE